MLPLSEKHSLSNIQIHTPNDRKRILTVQRVKFQVYKVIHIRYNIQTAQSKQPPL